GAMLALTRDLTRVDAALRRGTWESQWAVGAPSPPAWPELAGKTLGILGYGRIGQAVAQRARAFEMTILPFRRGDALDEVPPPARLSGHHALAQRDDPRPARRPRARPDEADGDPRQRRARPDRGRGRALPRAQQEDDRGRRPGRLVSLPDRHRSDVALAPSLPRALERPHDAARFRLD